MLHVNKGLNSDPAIGSSIVMMLPLTKALYAKKFETESLLLDWNNPFPAS